MSCPEALKTPRLRIRRWRAADRAPFAAPNADPEVMKFYPAALTATQSNHLVDRIERGFERDGFGLWAVENRSSAGFIGYAGLCVAGHLRSPVHPGDQSRLVVRAQPVGIGVGVQGRSQDRRRRIRAAR